MFTGSEFVFRDWPTWWFVDSENISKYFSMLFVKTSITCGDFERFNPYVFNLHRFNSFKWVSKMMKQCPRRQKTLNIYFFAHVYT